MLNVAVPTVFASSPGIDCSALAINELDALYEGLLAVVEAFAAASNVPRVFDTPLHSFFSARIEAVETECETVISELKRRAPTDEWEADTRALRLIAHAVRCGEGISDIEKLAASLKRAGAH